MMYAKESAWITKCPTDQHESAAAYCEGDTISATRAPRLVTTSRVEEMMAGHLGSGAAEVSEAHKSWNLMGRTCGETDFNDPTTVDRDLLTKGILPRCHPQLKCASSTRTRVIHISHEQRDHRSEDGRERVDDGDR